VASIYAWTGAIARRGELDGTPEVVSFAHALERAVIETIEGGTMTKDLLALTTTPDPKGVDTWSFMDAVASRLATHL
jgi:isocitrate dehydrogenase